MAIQVVAIANGTAAIIGNTYPVKDAIKAAGAKWDAAGKRWIMPSVEAADALAARLNGSDAAPSVAAPRTAYKRMTRCANCGKSSQANGGPMVERTDSSGISGKVCGSCARESRWHLSFA